MAILPGAIVKIVTRHTTPRVGQRGFCLHIAVSDGASLFNYFNQPGNPTSHFYVRRTGNTNGMADFEQYVDTKYRAPANLDGNPTLISLETQGGVGDDLNNPWPQTMVERIAWILAECHKRDGIPLRAMPNSRPESTGVGYHRQGVDPWRVDGGELWSNSYGKVCPGNARIAQIPYIINRAIQIAGDDMALTAEETAKLNKAAWLADQWAQGAQFEMDLNVIRSDLQLVLTTLLANQSALLAAQGSEDVQDDAQITALQGSVSALEAAVAAHRTAEAGRYSHVITTLTEWAETKDNIRHDELLAKLDELHPVEPPPEEPPPLP